jgi:uncharacterized XkdX family phage protein
MLDFEKIKDYYSRNLWTKRMVKMAVVKGRITAGQYKEITGEEYI